MNDKRQAICDFARDCAKREVKYRHQGRNPQVSLDCAGLVLSAGKSVGCVPADWNYSNYQREAIPGVVHEQMCIVFEPQPLASLQPGDIVELTDLSDSWPCHMGLLVDGNEGRLMLIHAFLRSEKVVTSDYHGKWEDCTAAAFRFRGIDD